MTASRRDVFVGTVLVIAAILAIAIYSSAQADTYTYDAYGRLTRVDYADGSYITYTYDPAGNRSQVTQVAAP